MAHPKALTAIVIAKPGAGQALVPAEKPMPSAGAGQVLIEVAAAGISRPDVFQRLGFYPPPAGAGLAWPEVAGRVVAAGPAVASPRLERVMALLPGGSCATHAIADATLCLATPDLRADIEMRRRPGGVFHGVGQCVHACAPQGGQGFLVHGGAVASARRRSSSPRSSARACSRPPARAKCAACRKLGADVAINYKAQDFAEVVKAETGGRGVDVILDMVGGPYIPKNIECLAEQGRHASIAFLKGAKAEVDFNAVMRKRLTLTGSTLRPRTLEEKTTIADELRAHVLPLLAARRVVPVIDSTFPLRDAAKAHARMDADQHTGKIILTV
ncbi:MAG: NAD(P)H-quinone oxidoreductase [Alphaproteobacteria bacterium]